MEKIYNQILELGRENKYINTEFYKDEYARLNKQIDNVKAEYQGDDMLKLYSSEEERNAKSQAEINKIINNFQHSYDDLSALVISTKERAALAERENAERASALRKTNVIDLIINKIGSSIGLFIALCLLLIILFIYLFYVWEEYEEISEINNEYL